MRRRKLLGRVIAFAMSLAIFGAECGSIPAMAAVSATGIESEIDASVDDVEQQSEVTYELSDETSVSTDDAQVSPEQTEADDTQEEVSIIQEEVTEGNVSADTEIADSSNDEANEPTENDAIDVAQEEVVAEDALGDEVEIESHVFSKYYAQPSGTFDFFMEFKDNSKSLSGGKYLWLTYNGEIYSNSSTYIYFSNSGDWEAVVCENLPISKEKLNTPISISWAITDRYGHTEYDISKATVYAQGNAEITVVEGVTNNTVYVEEGVENYKDRGDGKIVVDKAIYNKYEKYGSEEKISSLFLKNDNGIIAVSSNNDLHITKTTRSEVKSEMKSVYAYVDQLSDCYCMYNVEFDFVKYATVGSLDLYLKDSSGTEMLVMEDYMCVSSKGSTIVNSVYFDTYYLGATNFEDNKEYVFVRMYGQNIDQEKIHPEFTNKDSKGNALLQYVGEVTESKYADRQTGVYIFRKSEELINSDEEKITFGVVLVADEDYKFEDSRKQTQIIYYNQTIDLAETYYDYKNNRLEAKVLKQKDKNAIYDIFLFETDSFGSFVDGKFEIYDRYDEELGESKYIYLDPAASALGIQINSDMLLSAQLKDKDGKLYIPAYRGSCRVYLVDRNNNEATQIVSSSIYYYYNYSSATAGGTSTSTVNVTIYDTPIRILEGNKAEVWIYTNVSGKVLVVDSNNKEVVAAKSLSASKSTTKLVLATEKLSAGKYTIKFVSSDSAKPVTKTATLQVYPLNTFYLGTSEQYLSRNDDGQVFVFAYSPSTYLEGTTTVDDWRITVEDVMHTIIYQGKPSYVSNPTYSNGYISFEIPVPEGAESTLYKEYTGFYVKIERTYDNGITYQLPRYEFSAGDSLKNYYSNVSNSYYRPSDEHGMWYSFYVKPQYTGTCSVETMNADLSKHGYYAWYTNAPNAKVAVYQYKTIKKLAEIDFTNNTTNRYTNYPYISTFTDALIKEKGLSSNTVYSFRILNENGECIADNYSGYIVAAPAGTVTKPVEPTAIKFSATDVYLSKSEGSVKLGITATPSNAVVNTTFTSSRPEVVEIGDSNELILKQIGDAVITAKSQNGKTATCKVHVGELKDYEGNLQEKYTLNIGETLKLVYSDGSHAFPVNWSTSDRFVATVNNGYVTVVGEGDATITVDAPGEKVDVQIEGTELANSIHFTGSISKKNPGDTIDELSKMLKMYPVSIGYNYDILDNIVFYSDNEEVVKVKDDYDADAIKGCFDVLSTGTATITATLPAEFSATGEALTCSAKVLVIPDDYKVYVVSPMDKTLADAEYQLPLGWKFADSTIPISSISLKGQDVKIVNEEDESSATTVNVMPLSFKVMLAEKRTGGEVASVISKDEELYLEVCSADSETDNASLIVDKYTNYTIKPYIYAADSASKAVVDIPQEGNAPVTIKKAGKATIKYGFKLIENAGEGNKTATLTASSVTLNFVDTTSKGVADINVKFAIEDADGNITYPEQNVKDHNFKVKQSDKMYLINETEPYTSDGSNAIAYTSSDSAIVKIGTTSGAKTSIIAKSTGCVKITLKSKDAFGTYGEYYIDVAPETDKDGNTVYNSKNVVLDKYSATMNLNKEDCSDEVRLLVDTDVYAKSVKAYNKNGSENEHYTFEIDRKNIKIIAKEEFVSAAAKKAITESIYLTVTMDDSNSTEVKIASPLKVTVKSIWPKVAIKQLKKLNISHVDSYTYDNVLFSTSGERIEKITAGEDSKYEIVRVTGEKNSTFYVYTYLKDSATTSDAKKVSVPVNIKFEGYRNTYSTKFKVATCSDDIALTNSSGTIYLGQAEKLTTQIYNKTEKRVMSLDSISKDDIKIDSDSYNVDIDHLTNSLIITSNKPLAKGKSQKISFTLKTSEMRFEKKFSYTVKYAAPSSIALQLKNSKITLYKYADMGDSYTTELSLKGNEQSDNMMEKVVCYANSSSKTASEYDKIRLDSYISAGKIVTTVSIDDSFDIKAGTYYYTFKLSKEYTGAKKDSTAKLAITVKDARGKKTIPTVKTTAKGTLDALNGYSHLTITPKFTNVNLKDTQVVAKLNGRDAHFFDLSQDGKSLYVATDANLVAKYKYKVYVTYELTREDGFELILNSQVMTVQVSQSTPKISLATIRGNLLLDYATSVDITLRDAYGKCVGVEKVEFVSSNPAFRADDYSMSDGLKIRYDPYIGTAERGKTYTMTIKVYPEHYMSNVKPISVTYKVSIPK